MAILLCRSAAAARRHAAAAAALRVVVTSYSGAAALHVCDVPSAMLAYSHGLAVGEALEATPSECVAHAHFGGAAGAVVAVAAARSDLLAVAVLPARPSSRCSPTRPSLALTVTAPSWKATLS